MTTRERIAVIGSGLMGHGIAQVFACQGHPVVVMDTNADNLRSVPERIRANLSMMTAHGVKFPDDVETMLGRIRLIPDMGTIGADADFVFEAVFEDMALKQRIFAELDRIWSMPRRLSARGIAGAY